MLRIGQLHIQNGVGSKPQGFSFENKGTEALSFRQVYRYFLGSLQVNALRGVCGSDGVKRVVCRLRCEVFGCYIKFHFILIDN